MSGSDLGAEYPKCRLSVKLLAGEKYRDRVSLREKTVFVSGEVT
jgi:hypothetical protein